MNSAEPVLERVVFLFDVDNTLLDNDTAQNGYRAEMARQCGEEAAARYWAILQALTKELGYTDYLGALQRYRLEAMHDPQCQPIAIRNVVEFLIGVLGKSETYNKSYDIGGPDILSYKEMLLHFAKIRGLKRRIFVVPVMTPKISSYWLYFVTSTSFVLAKNLVNSMKIEVVCKPNDLASQLGISLIDYDTSIKLAFDKIEQNQVLSSWKDAQTSELLKKGLSKYIEVPVNGCFKDEHSCNISNADKVVARIWSIGGKTGWYYGNWLWEIRGLIDQLIGGVGMRRGRKSISEISPGDALDFWRVLIANREEKRLLLYAEMKLPGEAWLEFKIDKNNILKMTATFRPLGLLGRLYWYSVFPFHGFIFRGLLKNIAKQ